ncbi:MAG: response regulator, partial [Bacteroides sp.]
TFTRIMTKDGLPSNVVYKILEDDNQRFWLSTNNGLVSFNPEAMTVEALYNLPNGLQSKQFNYNSGVKAQDGTLYFGSINGFVAFNPKNFRPNDNKYSVVLTDFYVLNQEVKADSANLILNKAIPYADVIRLNYDQATFSFSFSALNYSTEGNGKYAYQLDGIDKNWNYIDNITRISYNSIPPGDYIFRIKYSKDGHDWSSEETRINIEIIPPLWQTFWAYALYILIVICIFYALIKFYITKKKKQVEEKLEHQEQMKKEEIYQAKIEFFTSIAHEIRTPITLIKAPLDYILTSEPDKHEVQENLKTMERNTDRLLVLVNQLLDFRKIESKAFTLSLKVKDINTLVTNTYNRFVPTARQKHLEMILECPSQNIMASIDEEAITKVCSNLFNKAIKYSSTYIHVILSESEDRLYFQITVKNDGNPIPVELRQSIFEAFFQIKNANQPAQTGSGIGLTLATSLVQLHNGKLFLDENAEDTSFIVQIPTNISPEDMQPSDPTEVIEEVTIEESISSTPSDALPSTKETILVVEDNAELQAFLNHQLGKHYHIITADNGVEAMEALKKNIINLIVSDVMMPLMDGLELCKSIKSNLETCHIPIILLTAKTTLNNKIEGLKNGADAYIEKPFSMPHLLVQINNLLENRMKLRQNFANNPYIATNSMAQNKADEDFLNKLTEKVKQNLDNENFNIDNLAEEMNMSRTSLHRKIKGITELTPGDFIRIIRLKKAAELLMEGEYRINEICMLVGIHSLSYFSKSFQKQFGVLPKDFAKNRGNQPPTQT